MLVVNLVPAFILGLMLFPVGLNQIRGKGFKALSFGFVVIMPEFPGVPSLTNVWFYVTWI
jgi:hypothetical protein